LGDLRSCARGAVAVVWRLPWQLFTVGRAPDGTCPMSHWPGGQLHRTSAILACMQATPGTPEPSADARLADHLYGLLKFLLHGHGGDYVRAVGELELSLTQLRALHVLAYDVEQTSLKELADRLGLSLPAVSRSIDGLVQRGLVTRSEDVADRRMQPVR